jgi:hypothetical protein
MSINHIDALHSLFYIAAHQLRVYIQFYKLNIKLTKHKAGN